MVLVDTLGPGTRALGFSRPERLELPLAGRAVEFEGFDAVHPLPLTIAGNQAGIGGPWHLQWLSVVSRVHGEDEPTASVTLAHEDGSTATSDAP